MTNLFIARCYLNEVTGPEVALKWIGKSWNEIADNVLKRLMEEGDEVMRIQTDGSVWLMEARR